MVLLLGFGLSGLQAQEAISAAGSNASGSGGSASYSVGQVVYTTNTGTNGTVYQGVQLPYEIFEVIIDGLKGITLECSAYPNPTSDFLILKADYTGTSTMSLQLYDINGKLLETQKVESTETRIDMSQLAVSTYFLRVIQDEKEIKSFKIIKN